MVKNMNTRKNIKLSGHINFKNKKRGSYTVEAAIFLPIFTLAVLTIGYVVRIIGTCENINFAIADELSYVSARAYIDKTPTGFKSTLKNRVTEENNGVENFKINSFRYLYRDAECDNLIKINLKYRASIKLPLDFADGINVNTKYLTRGFTGSHSNNSNMPFSKMEKNENSNTVWIFLKSGKKYHSRNCPFVTPYPTQMLLTDLIKSSFSACELCDSENIPNGSPVYVFLNSGRTYHKASCKTIKKYIVEIDRQDAIERGYTPCARCGGK